MSDGENRTGPVVVTGGTGGLGPAVVERLRAAGRDVVVLALEGGDVDVDLTDADAARAAVQQAGARVSGLVCLAGGFAAGTPAAEAPEGELDRMLALNVRTAANAIRPALPLMRDGGSVVVIGSRAVHAPFPGAAAYIASKAALVAYAQAVAADFPDRSIRANAVLPGMIDTPANRDAMPDMVDQMTPPERIADVIAFLISPASRTITGAAIPV